ncbi:CYTH and CHAD domain-containing protein [Corynebacterium pygosceleis]|uniref:CYTH and CHAD domain-containing protein n=1 Tax=Corynebacterium pygosceleis TaxID=2800406 RepID=A0A9Q4C816_9CORY|nr:CYTH and CHAD domain-containing protein [Corynebacterium pygosceleis]MCK7636580.1 CYTH and CHAD domain-containing protein [Corynebacterium pygosceleis]MCK7675154.1 CYTH and CHAD domain-containing protein [Corynebacterium pygosceleis]MCL0120629.1 CYTH and CHAD domain-containing protein [Corynebacterium pygosceleis]MCX7467333.1 CYTH and CHAD domain-containing protein [Corynebacterium pygosceleis]
MPTSEFFEVEAKFAVTDGTEVPDLTGIPTVSAVTGTTVHELSAVYYDTGDLRLTRSRITLRRRTGGTDAGWHAKLPGDGGRRELHHELTDGDVNAVPRALIDPVRAIVRDLPLIPIARVDNERHGSVLVDSSGTVCAEFCDDHVTAWSLLPGGERTTWREWEIELSGDYAGTDAGVTLIESAAELFGTAGAGPSESPSKLVAALGDSIDDAPHPPGVAEPAPGSTEAGVLSALEYNYRRLLDHDPRVRRDEWDSVHQMRVATRELRSHLETFDGVMDGDSYRDTARGLRELAAVLGTARDAEVVAERFRDLTAGEQSGIVSPASAAALVDSVRADYRDAHARVVEYLNSPGYLRLLAELEELLADPPFRRDTVTDAGEKDPGETGDTTAEVLLDRLGHAYRKLLTRHDHAMAVWEDRSVPLREREENIHRIRKAAKKLRYSAEAVGAATGLKTKHLYKACGRMQSVLGDFQDAVTSRDILLAKAEQARAAGDGTDTFLHGLLYQRELNNGDDALAGYRKTMDAVVDAYSELDNQRRKNRRKAGDTSGKKGRKH